MRCDEVLDLLTEYLEAALSPGLHSLVEAHLAECDGCLRHLDQLRSTIRLTGTLREQNVPREVLAQLLDAFRAWRAGGRRAGS